MDVHHPEIKDVIQYCLLPLLDPITRILFCHSIYFVPLPQKLNIQQLIALAQYPSPIKYFSDYSTCINRRFLKTEAFMLMPCGWYPYYDKTNTYRKYTEEEYKSYYHYHDRCYCIKCLNLGAATVKELIPFFLGIEDKTLVKYKRYRTKYENRLYALGMISNKKIYDLDKAPFRQLLHNHMNESLIYFAVMVHNTIMLDFLFRWTGMREIDRGLRWLSDDDFMWVVNNFITEDNKFRIAWPVSVLSRDRLSNYYHNI